MRTQEHRVGRYSYRVTEWPGYATVTRQPINPRTGEPWQATRNIVPMLWGDDAYEQAVRAWETAIAASQAGA